MSLPACASQATIKTYFVYRNHCSYNEIICTIAEAESSNRQSLRHREDYPVWTALADQMHLIESEVDGVEQAMLGKQIFRRPALSSDAGTRHYSAVTPPSWANV